MSLPRSILEAKYRVKPVRITRGAGEVAVSRLPCFTAPPSGGWGTPAQNRGWQGVNTRNVSGARPERHRSFAQLGRLVPAEGNTQGFGIGHVTDGRPRDRPRLDGGEASVRASSTARSRRSNAWPPHPACGS